MGEQYESKDLTGALFKNDKGDNPKRPDYRGNAVIRGVKYTVSAWLKKSQAGKVYMSMSYQEDDGTKGKR